MRCRLAPEVVAARQAMLDRCIVSVVQAGPPLSEAPPLLAFLAPADPPVGAPLPGRSPWFPLRWPPCRRGPHCSLQPARHRRQRPWLLGILIRGGRQQVDPTFMENGVCRQRPTFAPDQRQQLQQRQLSKIKGIAKSDVYAELECQDAAG